MGLANEKIITQVEDLLNGKIVIPSIQRDFVWMRPDVRDLFDSLRLFQLQPDVAR